MAVRMNATTEAISLQDIGTMGKPSPHVQFLPPQPKPPKQQKSHWLAAKRILRSSKPHPHTASEKVPDYLPMYVPLSSGFESEETLARLLTEVSKRDDQIQQYLDERKCVDSFDYGSFDRSEEERDKFDEDDSSKPKEIPEDLAHFQDFVCQFFAFFLQTPYFCLDRRFSADRKWANVVHDMASSRSCPELLLFRRVMVDPRLIAGRVPEEDNLGYADNGVAINQLARFLDVAVVKFLGGVNEHTDPRSVAWALDYLTTLLQSLISSMNNLNSFGWYRAPHMRIRKGTAVGRVSMSYPLQPPLIINPPVVVVGTPPTSPHAFGASYQLPSPNTRDPVTGQHSPHLSPLAVQQVRAPVSGESSSSSSSNVSPATSSISLPAVKNSRSDCESREASSSGATPPGGRSRRTSRQEFPSNPPMLELPQSRSNRSSSSPIPKREKAQSDTAHQQCPSHPPPLHGILKTPLDIVVSPPRSPNASMSSRAAAGRQRRPTPAGPPPGLVLPGGGKANNFHSSPVSSPRRGSMNMIKEDHEEEEIAVGSEEQLEAKQQSAKQLPKDLGSDRQLSLATDIPLGSGNGSHSSALNSDREDLSHPDSTLSPDHSSRRRERVRSPSPHLGSISESEDNDGDVPIQFSCQLPGSDHATTPHRTLTPPLSPSSRDSSSLRSSLSPPPGSSTLRSLSPSSPPPPLISPKDMPRVDVGHELSTLTNAEGRISLLAILHAVSKLPSCKEVWSDEVSEKCFTLIQFCIDVGLPQKEESISQQGKKKGASGVASSLHERRKWLMKQEKTTERLPEKPWNEHGKFIIQFALSALIQCSTCSLVGCSSDGMCRLQKYMVPTASRASMYNKLIRNLKRISLHSPKVFREAVTSFAQPSSSSCQKLFSFLHVVLQYCMHSSGMGMGGPLTDTMVVGMAGAVVDRLASLDLSEDSIQESVIREACDFLAYSGSLFAVDSEVKSRRHLHMYIHRVALSVLLPPHPSTRMDTPTNLASNFTSVDIAGIKGTDQVDGTSFDSSLMKLGGSKLTKRGTLVHALSSSPLLARRGASTTTYLGGQSSRESITHLDRPRHILQKQNTAISFVESPPITQEDRVKGKGKRSGEATVTVSSTSLDGGGEVGGTHWRGLDVEMLRTRIERLSTLLELTEPGTVPEAGMLASLVDLCDGSTVVARAMVLVECALLVKKLRTHSASYPATVWLRHNQESPRLLQVASNFRKWAEALGERVRLAELREKNTKEKATEGKECGMEEEPVFPGKSAAPGSNGDLPPMADVPTHSPGGYTVSYALKMCACNLLLEVTRFLRELPVEFIPAHSSISQAGTPLNLSGHFDRFIAAEGGRKYSNTSQASSDAEGGTSTVHFPNPKPRLSEARSNYGSSLSVEDMDVPLDYSRALSVDEHGTLTNASPGTNARRNRTSVYLSITPSFKGTLSRNTSTRRQSRRIVLTDTSKPEKKQFVSVSPLRMRRRSVSTSVQHRTSGVGAAPSTTSARRPSLFVHPSLANQTSLGGGVSNAGVNTYLARGRRQSMGASLHYTGDNSELFPPPVTPTTPGGTFFQPLFGRHGVGGGGVGGAGVAGGATGGNSLGNSLNIGLTKLKRSAQKAFRRGTKARSTLDPGSSSPSNSPGVSQRRWFRRGSTTESLQRSTFMPTQPEETRVNYPWLDVVEHLVLVQSVWSSDQHIRNKQSCLELTAALKKIYSHQSPGKEADEEEPVILKSGKDRSGAFSQESVDKHMKRYSSLGSIFVHGTSVVDPRLLLADGQEVNYARGQSLPALTTMSIGTLGRSRCGLGDVSPLRSSSIQPSIVNDTLRRATLKQLSFADLNFVRLNDILMGGANSSHSGLTSEETIQLTIESESRYEREHIEAKRDEEVCKYLDQSVAGFQHTVFSVLISAAPILHSRTFSGLKGIAWETLLSVDVELSHAAGSFFLLSAAKESERQMKGFLKSRVLSQTSVERKNAILRFKVLWNCRYGVWSRMEERGQKKFVSSEREDKEKEKTIGYSQLANPLGDQGDYLPLSPSVPISVCMGKACANNPDKCYRPTKMAPVFHPKDISGAVHVYPVSGVSIAQEVGGTRSSSVVYKVDSDEVAGLGAREFEAVDPTLFPHSLLPLIKFLLYSLVPRHSDATPTSKTTPSSDHTHSNGSVDLLECSELARQVVWACMVEDPRLFFRPLLHKFNKIYMLGQENKRSLESLMAETLEPFHIVLQEFPKLPPRAAHMLLNNFVGVVLQNTDQPHSLSARIIQDILTLISMVTSSVQGLETKLLKSYLKKESCYTNIMATARIRGVDRVTLVQDHHRSESRLYKVTDNEMTFGHLIAEARQPDSLSLKLLSRWYLVDKNTELPVLSTLVVQDHYSASTNKTNPTFVLHKVRDSPEKFWSGQMDKLLVFKMSEVVKVLFSTQLLLTGPEVEKTHTYSEYALPNYQFIHKELMELNSFPRKALTSIQHEAGPNAFQNMQLHASDVMLKGMWVQFVSQLMLSAGRDYDWAGSLPLFMNVVNGSLVLHSENQTILYLTLSTMLLAAAKFSSIFKKDGYLMVIPALVQVYSLHMKNKVLTSAICFIWLKFYTLDGNHFISQLMAASSTLLSEEVASLSHSIAGGTSLTGMLTSVGGVEAEEARRLIARALFELNGVLVDPQHVQDELRIMRFCQNHLDSDLYARLDSYDSNQSVSVKETALLAIVFAGWNPEAIRGMQVLVYLDHMMPLFLPVLGTLEQKFITDSLQYLVKKCENISKAANRTGGELFSRKAGVSKSEGGSNSKVINPGQSFTEDDITDNPALLPTPTAAAPPPKSRKISVAEVVTKILYNPNRRDRLKTSPSHVSFAAPSINDDRDGNEDEHDGEEIDDSVTPSSKHSRGAGRSQGSEQLIFQQSRNALLSAVSEVFAFYCTRPSGECVPVSIVPARRVSVHATRKVSLSATECGNPDPRISLDSGSVNVIINTVCQVLKQGTANTSLLRCPGLNRIFFHFLSGLDWTENHFSAFGQLLHRLCRVFKILQKESEKVTSVWDNLTSFISGVTACIKKNPQLVRGQDQHLTKFKNLLETLVAMQRGESQWASNINKKLKGFQQQPLFHPAPPLFTEAVIKLAAELIIITSSPRSSQLTQGKFRYRITDLVSQKFLKGHEEFIIPTIILPLCIQLGFSGGSWQVMQEDIDYFMAYIESKVDIFHRLKNSHQIPEQVLRVMRVFCCSLAESFSVQQWTRVSHWITSLFMRMLSVSPNMKKVSTSSSVKKGGGGIRGRVGTGVTGDKLRGTRLPSASGSTGTSLEAFISFHENLLSFFEDFVVHCRVPLLPLLQPILWKMSVQLELEKQKLKVDFPAHLDKVTSCIDRCHKLKCGSLVISRFRSRHQLLLDLQDQLKSISSQNSGKSTLLRSNTTVESNQRAKPTLSRRLSDVALKTTLSNIKEGADEEGLGMFSLSLPRNLSALAKSEENAKATQTKKSSSLAVPRGDDKRPSSLSLKPPKTVSIDETPSPMGCGEIKLHSPPPAFGLSLSPRSALRKRSLDRRTQSSRFSSVESLDEVETVNNSSNGPASPRHLPPPKGSGRTGRRSPKLGLLGKSTAIGSSIEYPGDVEDENIEDAVVLENALTQTPSPKMKRMHSTRESEEDGVIVNTNVSMTSSPHQSKKRVAFSSESQSQSISLPLRTVQVEVHYDPEESNNVRGSCTNESYNHLEDSDLQQRENYLEDSTASNTHLIQPTNEEPKMLADTKKTRSMEASLLRPQSPKNRSTMSSNFAREKTSMPVVGVYSDRDQLLEDDSRHSSYRVDAVNFPYEMWQDGSEEADSRLLKSQSLDRAHGHSAGGVGNGSRSLTSALKEGTRFLYRLGQRSKSDQNVHEEDN